MRPVVELYVMFLPIVSGQSAAERKISAHDRSSQMGNDSRMEVSHVETHLIMVES